jgi:hypothetical protein
MLHLDLQRAYENLVKMRSHCAVFNFEDWKTPESMIAGGGNKCVGEATGSA